MVPKILYRPPIFRRRIFNLKAHDGNRTRDLFLTKEVLYRLSYMGEITVSSSLLRLSAQLKPPPTAELFAKWSGRRDSNPRPRAWKARALPTELLPL